MSGKGKLALGIPANVARRLEEALHIRNIIRLDVSMAVNAVPRAKVWYYLDDETVVRYTEVVAMCQWECSEESEVNDDE